MHEARPQSRPPDKDVVPTTVTDVRRLSQITPAAFDKFRAHCREIGHSPRTLFHEAVVVKQWLKWCHRRYLVAANTLADYKLTKPTFEPRDAPSLEQVNAVLDATRSMRKLQYGMLAFTSMRSGELQRLHGDDVDLKSGWITIASRQGAETKTRYSRKVPEHPRLGAMLKTMSKSRRPWFFVSGPSSRYPNGDHWINPKRLNEDFIKLLKKLKLPTVSDQRGFTIHSLRHFMETFCVNVGIPSASLTPGSINAPTAQWPRFTTSSQRRTRKRLWLRCRSGPGCRLLA